MTDALMTCTGVVFYVTGRESVGGEGRDQLHPCELGPLVLGARGLDSSRGKKIG